MKNQSDQFLADWIDAGVKVLREKISYKNVMQFPRFEKVVLNVGIKEGAGDAKVVARIMNMLSSIAGQKAMRADARASIAGFKIREKMPIGAFVTLRGKNMVNFLAKFINIVLPRIRDFHGVSRKFDGRGNYNFGVKEVSIFPEIDFNAASDRPFGMNISIVTTACHDQDALLLFESYGMPFVRS